MKKHLFRKFLHERYGRTDCNSELVRVLGISPNTATARLSNKQPLRTDELEILRKEYDLTAEELVDVFVKEGD